MMLYLVGGLAVAVAVAGGIASCERKRANAAERATAQVQGQYDAYRLNQEALAEKEKVDNDAKERKWNESNRASSATIAGLRRALDDRVRDAARAIIRPDGSTIRETACPGPVADGAPGKPVPDPESYVAKADYLALEDRSALDALKVVGLQKYVRDVCLSDGPVTGSVESGDGDVSGGAMRHGSGSVPHSLSHTSVGNQRAAVAHSRTDELD